MPSRKCGQFHFDSKMQKRGGRKKTRENERKRERKEERDVKNTVKGRGLNFRGYVGQD